MNPCIPDWNLEAELPMPSQKKPFRLDDGLVELLWQNGHVVLHSQNHRKPGYDPNENRQVSKHDQSSMRASCSCENPSNLIQENDTVSWLHTPLDDPFEKELYSNFLSDIPGASLIQTDKPIQQLENNKTFKFDASDVNHVISSSQNCGFNPNPLPPPKFRSFDPSHHAPLQDIPKSMNFHSLDKNDLRYSNGQHGDRGHCNMTQGEIKEYSVMTVGSSHCGSNQVAMDADTSRVSTSGIRNGGLSASVVKNYVEKISPHNEKSERETLETAITSSSGGSGSSFGRTCNLSTSNNSLKRKTRDAEESECQSEAAALDSAGGDKLTQKSGTSRRSRAAEVHNLSERRRRDRINEKMRALQALIPHSNKTDKASMLDEAIEYMKSLQFQLQMLWMGGGMAPMMFPGVQHYMSRMGMGMAPPTLPPIHGAMHLPRIPLVDQAINIAPTPNQPALCQTPVLNAVNLQNQLRNPNFSDQYGSYLGFHPLQSASQPINMFSFGPNAAQQNAMLGQSGHSTGPST